jgi:diguanylate cyclase (GGDEF)-like protein/PAS domain S-box-containing protein
MKHRWPISLFLGLLMASAMVFAEAGGPGREAEPEGSGLPLTAEERAYLDGLSSLRVPVIEGQPPLSFTADGAAAGYLNELFAELADALDLSVEWVRGLSYAESLSALERADVDVLNDYSTTSEPRPYLLETDPVLSVPFVAVGRSDASPVRGVSDLAGKRVAVVVGFRQTQLLRGRYPDLDLVSVDGIRDAYRALRSGDADYYIDNASHAGYYLREQIITDLAIAGELPASELGVLQLSIAVASDKPLLHSALAKALAATPDSRISDLRAKWLRPYRQAPDGLAEGLALTAEEREWLARHPRIEVGVNDAWPPFGLRDRDGELVGFGVDLVAALNRRLDDALVPVGGAWDDLYGAVAQRRLPALLDLTAKPSRDADFNFTRPYLEIPHVIVARKDGPFYAGEDALAGETLALERGFGNVEYFRSHYPDIPLKLYPSTEAALEAVLSGDADAYAGNRSVASYLLNEGLMLDLEIQGRLRKDGSVLSIGTRKDWPILADILDKALADLSVAERQTLLGRWVGHASPRWRRQLRLTDVEQAWLEEHPVLRIAPDPHFPPLEFFDENGRYRGLVADYMRLVSERLGVELEVVRRNSWSEAIEALRVGEADLIGANVPTDAFREEFLFTESYFGFYDVIVTHDGIPGSVRLEDLAGERVLVAKDWPEVDILRELFPYIEPVEVRSTLEGVRKVALGEFDYLFTYLPTAAYLIEQQGLSGLRIAGYGPDPIMDAAMVRKDAGILRSILDKALATVTPEEKWAIESRWIQRDADIGTLIGLGLTEEEQRWLREHPSLEFHTTTTAAPYQFQSEDGETAGIVPEMIDIIGRRLGIRFEIIADSDRDAVAGLRSGRFELFGAIPAETVTSDMPYLRTRPFLRGDWGLFGRTLQPSIASIDQVRDRTIVAGETVGADLLDALAEHNEIIRVPSLEKMAEALLSGRADYGVGISAIVERWLHERQYQGIRRLYTDPEPLEGVLLVRDGHPLLRSIMDKALADVGTRELPRILRKWYIDQPVPLALTDEELDWLAANPVVRVALDPTAAPIEYRDDSGRYAGISADYLARLEAILGVELEVVPGLSWTEGVAAVENRTADMLASVARTPERETYALFTRPYIDMPIRIFAREDAGYLGDLTNLAGRRVAVAAGYAIEDWLRRDHPELNLVAVESPSRGLEEVAAGTVDAFVGNLVTGHYYLKKLDLQGVREAGETPYRNSRSMAVRSDWPLFAGILQKALDMLSEADHQAIYNRWMGIEFERAVDYRLLWQVVIGALLVLLAVVYWNRRLAHEVGMRKVAEVSLKAHQEELEQRVSSRTAALAASEQRYRGIVEDTPSMICRFRPDGVIDYVNRAYSEHLERRAEDLIGDNYYDLLPRPARGRIIADIQALSAQSPICSNEHQVATSSGGIGWQRWTNRAIFDASGAVQAYQAIGEDITERRGAEEVLNNFFEQPATLNLIARLDGTIQRVNASWESMLGYSRAELEGGSFLDYVHPEDQDATLAEMARLAEGQVTFYFENRYRHRDGGYRRLAWSAKASVKERMIYSVATDITEKRRGEDRLREAAAVFSNTAEGVIITDLDGTIRDINKAFSEITGYSREEIIGQNPSKFQSGRHDRPFYQAMWQALLVTGGWRGEIWNRRKDGSIYPALLTISTVRDSQSQPSGYIGVCADITALKQTEDRLEHLAHHDPLTDLPNRSLLNERLAQAIKHAKRNRTELAVLFLDLDRFKVINDSLGHSAGDQLLVELARRLLGAVRAADTVARISGDEFVVLLEDVRGGEGAALVAEKLIAAMKAPFDLEGNTVRVTTSLGLSLYPRDGEDAATLLRNADAAMYRAKDDGRNNYKFYTEELTAAAFEHMLLETALRGAIQNRELRLVYQPKVDLMTGRLIGMETLLRWRHSSRGHISPAQFIPVAERTGLIREIGEWVMVTASRQGREWLDRGFDIGRIAVNVAGPQIQQADFVSGVADALEQTGLPPSHLELEVTESFVMQRAEESIGKLEAIRALGISIAIDDFGTGYSSMNYLKRLPVDRLKIDQSFVRDIPADRNDMAIAEAIIALGTALDQAVIAEGVETAEQAAFLKDKGCTQAQGYYFGRPVPPEEFEPFLAPDWRFEA